MFDSDFRLTIPSILNPSETHSLVERILDAADGVISTDPASLERKQHVSLTQSNQDLAAAVGKGRTVDPQTQVKAEADAKRDAGFVRVKDTVNGILVRVARTCSVSGDVYHGLNGEITATLKLNAP
jgi:hypothetical protein